MRHEQALLQQILGYVKPVIFPSLCNDLVMETLKRSKELAAECGLQYIVVTKAIEIYCEE